MSAAQLFSLLAGPLAFLAVFGLIRLGHALLDFAGRQLAQEALSNDPYGNDRILGDLPRVPRDDELHHWGRV